MYQFYYADKTISYDRGQCKDDIRNHFDITAIRPAMWEEHCLECSAPLCFSSCLHYEARSDGRCKRFDNGLSTFSDEKACCGQGVHIKFRKWGNMMTVLFPAMLSKDDYQKMQSKNEKLGNVLKKIESSSLPQSIRWQSIRIPEFIRRRNLRKLSGTNNRADAFIFHGFSYNNDSYRLIIEIYDESTPVFKTALNIHQGENLSVIDNLSEECSIAGRLVKIYPENNIEAELDILWCDFVRGKAIAPEHPAEKVKCVVWDLDGTLWNGTLIETDNPDTLILKNGIREVIEEFDRRGIIQSIASKNDHDAAMKVLEQLNIAEYFLYPQIHWNPKSDSISQIAKSLNIGIDSLAFIDDTVFERNQVNSVWQQVRTYAAEEVDDLLGKREFDVPVTNESRNRRAMYRAEERRNELKDSQQTDIVEFLKKCNLKLRIFNPSTDEEQMRCYELVVRTNQLNMTGIKYTREQFQAILCRPDHTNFAFSCSDDFGDYGIVGYGQYKIDGQEIIFSEFAMSCRVAGKFVESALFSHILTHENCKNGIFTVQITKKNILLRNSLEKIGFSQNHNYGEKIQYTFDVNLKNKDIVGIDIT